MMLQNAGYNEALVYAITHIMGQDVFLITQLSLWKT